MEKTQANKKPPQQQQKPKQFQGASKQCVALPASVRLKAESCHCEIGMGLRGCVIPAQRWGGVEFYL